MRIAVVGCGAVGSFYGAKLCRDGHDVLFLVRSDYDVVSRRGIEIRSYQGDFAARPRCARTPEEIGQVDLVLVGLKTTANHQFPVLIPPLAGPRTVVLTLQNGLGNEEQLARLFPIRQIMGGLCFVCLNRVAPGVVHHLDHGRIVVGEHRRSPEPRTHEIAGWFRRAGVPCEVTDDLARAHWEKLVWNVPFNGLGVAGTVGYEAVVRGEIPVEAKVGPCLATDALLRDPRWEELLRELMHEVIATARALGFLIPESLAEVNVELTRTMGAYKASTLIDFERRQPLEVESLFKEPLRQARAAGVAAPRLSALCRILEALSTVLGR